MFDVIVVGARCAGAIKARNQMIDPASFFNRVNIGRLLGQSQQSSEP